MERLVIEKKTNNQGINTSGRLPASEFNKIPGKINELVDYANKTVYCTQDEYDAWNEAGELVDDVEYNVYDE